MLIALCLRAVGDAADSQPDLFIGHRVSAVQQGVLAGMSEGGVAGGFGLLASLGSQHSRSEQRLSEQTSSGSQLKAGGDMTLDTARDIRLEASQNTSVLGGNRTHSSV